MKKLAGLLVLMAVTSSAYAGGGGGGSVLCQIQQWLGLVPSCSDGNHHHGGPIPAPELDPSSAVSAITLLLGGLAILRPRRR